MHLPNYGFYENYRYENKFLTKFPYNENNAIITDQEVIYSNTHKLPWIPSNPKLLIKTIYKAALMPRIATAVIVKNKKFNHICMINTHLDYLLKDQCEMQRIPINQATWISKKGEEKTLDHIFVPHNWDIESFGILNPNETKEISDHRLIYTTVRHKN